MSLTRANVNCNFSGYWNYQHAAFQFGIPGNYPQTAALMFGGGTAASPLTTSAAGASFMKLYCQSTDTGDDNRLMYAWLYAAGIGGGFEAFRGRVVGTVTGLNDIRGGNFTAALDATTSNISGMAAGVQATFEALAATKTIGGTIASLVCTSFVGAGNTLPTAHSFIRCVDEGSVKFSNFLNLDGVSTGSNNVFQSASNTTCSHKIRCLINGTVYYLMVDATL